MGRGKRRHGQVQEIKPGRSAIQASANECPQPPPAGTAPAESGVGAEEIVPLEVRRALRARNAGLHFWQPPNAVMCTSCANCSPMSAGRVARRLRLYRHRLRPRRRGQHWGPVAPGRLPAQDQAEGAPFPTAQDRNAGQKGAVYDSHTLVSSSRAECRLRVIAHADTREHVRSTRSGQ